MKKFLLTLIFGIYIAHTACAQRVNQAISSSSVDYYIEQYDFENAQMQLERNITLLKRKKQPTDLAEKTYSRINRMQNMVKATEKVLIIDSMVVNKKNFLEKFKISPESGKISYYSDFFNKKDSVERTVYLSELGNKICFADIDSTGKTALYTSDLVNEKWNTPKHLDELSVYENANYPFMLSDGVTLYYAAKGEESIGGYDIFVTRYDLDERKFLYPENIGMPFNSPANDYMYAIDEFNKLGWFVSDRNQPEDKVCIYIFEPSQVRHVYSETECDSITIRRMARICSIAETWGDKEALNNARKRLQAALDYEGEVVKYKDFDFVISDEIIYTLVSDFKSPEAKTKIAGWKEKCDKLKSDKEKLNSLRNQYATGNAALKKQLTEVILNLEKEYENNYNAMKKEEIFIRNAENIFLNK